MTARECRRRQLLWTIQRWLRQMRHCEEAAKQPTKQSVRIDCFATLAMTLIGLSFSTGAFAAEPTKITSDELLKMISGKQEPAAVVKSAAPAAAPAVAKPYVKKVDPELLKMKGTESTIRGEVRMKIKMGMGIIYNVDSKKGSSQEFWVDFTDTIRVKGLPSVHDFESGDLVEVTLKTVKVGELKKRIVTGLSLVKRMTQAEKDALAKKEAEEEKRAQMKAEAMASEEG